MAETSTRKKRQPKGRSGDSEPAFMRKAELARELGIDRKTLDRGIAAGTIPPPHSRLGPRVAIWRREHYRAFEANGRWPAEAFPRRQG